VLDGLRKRGDDAQLTQVIASVAQSDPKFAGALAALLVSAASKRGSRRNVQRNRMEPVPPELTVAREHSLHDFELDKPLGRVDLSFVGDNFVLFVENKLHSGYGDRQLERYLAALRTLPNKPRAGLLAVTSDVPGYGEPNPAKEPHWLGSVRWAHVIGDLRAIEIANATVRRQWHQLIDLLDEEGDFGMTAVDTDLIRAWGRFWEGRTHVAQLLAQIQGATSKHAHTCVMQRYTGRGGPYALFAEYRRGAQGTIQEIRQTGTVWIGFQIPASDPEPRLRVQFVNTFGVPHFTIEAWPWEHERLRASGDSRFVGSGEMLQRADFATDPRNWGRYWSRVHGPDEYLEADDVPATLMALVEADVRTLVDSGIFDAEVETQLPRVRDQTGS